jgi:DNA polymerase
VTARCAPRSPIADIARQARDLLGRVRDSRWPDLAPAPARTAARPGAATGRAPAAARPAASAPARTAGRERPAPPPPTPAATAAVLELPGPWSSLEQIARAIEGCTKCPLHASRTRAVPGEGNPNPRLLFVGEAPGADEDRLGRPFVGAAGQLLDRMIAAMGLARGDVFIANVLKCRPPGNRAPLPAEVEACAPHLRAQIQLLAPEVICTLGNPATQTLLGVTEGIRRMRGRFSSYRGTPVLPTFHPSYLLRTPADKRLAWDDLQQIMDRLGLPPRGPSPARESE